MLNELLAAILVLFSVMTIDDAAATHIWSKLLIWHA